MTRIADFLLTYRLYRRSHSVRYALQSAWRINVQQLPF